MALLNEIAGIQKELSEISPIELTSTSQRRLLWFLLSIDLLAYLSLNALMPGKLLVIRLLLCGLMMLGAGLIWFRFYSKRHPVFISVFLFLFLFLIGETYLQLRPITFGPGDGLNSVEWYARYWQPVNSLGYRDREPEAADTNKKTVLVIGDSFTAAQGVEDVNDRYTEILAQKLGPDYVVWNAGECGAGSEKELQNLRSFPFRPDHVIIQWFVNDIEDAAHEMGKNYHHPAASGWRMALRKPAKFSYILDLLSTFALFNMESGYDKWLDEMYADKAVFNRHFSDLVAMQEHCDSIGAECTFILAPFLFDPQSSKHYLEAVKNALNEKGCRFFDLSESTLSITAAERIASPFDRHPSEKLNGVWGIELAKWATD